MPDEQTPEVDPSLQTITLTLPSLQPAAGGWVPTPRERALAIGIVSTLGSVALGAPSVLPGTPGLIVALVCGALAFGIGTAFGMQSAGPRRLP